LPKPRDAKVGAKADGRVKAGVGKRLFIGETFRFVAQALFPRWLRFSSDRKHNGVS
jgi:hypothetical protein